MFEFERSKDMKDSMGADVTERTGAEVPPSSPAKGKVCGVIRPVRSGPQPEVPVEPVRYARRFFGPTDGRGPAIGATRSFAPDVCLTHRTYRTVGYPLAFEAVPLPGLARVSHLRSYLGRLGSLRDGTSFINGPCKRLFTVNMFAHLDGHHRDDSVQVVRRGDENGINMLFLFQHLTVSRDI